MTVLLAVIGIVAFLVALALLRKPRREDAYDDGPPADERLWDVLRGG